MIDLTPLIAERRRLGMDAKRYYRFLMFLKALKRKRDLECWTS
jgi:hypothetical protein